MSPKKVLVVIPTAANELDLSRINTVVGNISNRVRQLNLQPIFLVVCRKGQVGLVRERLKESDEQINFKFVKNVGLGDKLFTGFSHGLRKYSPDYVLPFMADFEMESEHADKLLQPLLQENADFVTAKWPSDYSSALEFPLPQYLIETRISAGAIYADPHFHPQDLRVYPAVNLALKEGNKPQTFTGLFAFRAGSWPTLKHGVSHSFKGVESHVVNWGFEPALLLSALKHNLHVAVPSVPRGFEHPLVTPEEKRFFTEKRIIQFSNAMSVIRQFLVNSRQPEKVPHFDDFVAREKERMKKSPLFRDRQKDLIDKFKPKFLYH